MSDGGCLMSSIFLSSLIFQHAWPCKSAYPQQYIFFLQVSLLGWMRTRPQSISLRRPVTPPWWSVECTRSPMSFRFRPQKKTSIGLRVKTVSTGADVLVTVKHQDTKTQIIVNCDKLVIGSMLLKDLKVSLLKPS